MGELELSLLDKQQHYRVYIRQLIFFDFPDPGKADAAFHALRHGLAATLCRFPYLAGKASVRSDLPQGELRIQYPSPIHTSLESTRILNDQMNFQKDAQLEYHLLKEKSFPPCTLPASTFCPFLLRHQVGLDDGDPYAEGPVSFTKRMPLPVFAAQATFIPGGLILSVWSLHALADGIGISRVLETWSAEVRAFHQHFPQTSLMCKIPNTHRGDYNEEWLRCRYAVAEYDPSAPRRALAHYAHRANDKKPPKIFEDRPTLRRQPYGVATSVLRMSSYKISELSSYLSVLTKDKVSPFVALATLLWTHIIQARLSLLQRLDDPTITLGVIADLRRSVGYPYTAPDFIGNLVRSTESCVRLTTASGILNRERPIVSRDMIVFALKILDSIHAVTKDWTIDRLHELKAYGQSDTAGVRYTNGPDLYITSWVKMGADFEWDIPGTSSAKPAAIRRASWVSEGGITVLPRRKDTDAPFEVQISLAEDDLRSLIKSLRNGGWTLE
ncbi:hypothetical protein ACN47E_008255 [Coniothyrium glycines]